MDQAENLRNIIKKDRQNSTARVITVTSGKGGVGKSNVSVNLAIQFQRRGKRVVILDADFGLANVEVMLGIRPKYNLADLMFNGKSLKEIITSGPENIGFISGGSGIQELSNLNRDQILNLTQKLYELDNLADIILIDTGAGISDNVLEFVLSSSEVLLVATPEPTSITDAYALLKTLDKKAGFSKEDTVIRMIANRVTSLDEGKSLYHKLSIVVNKFLNVEFNYLGSIPQDDNVTKAVMQQKPAVIYLPSSPFSKAVYELSGILCGDKELQEHKQSGIARLFSNLIRTKFLK